MAAPIHSKLSRIGGFDCILGNPPFLNQLETATASNAHLAAIVNQRSGAMLRGYTDLSATFLLFSAHILRDGGFLSMVQPQSFLAAKDAGSVRRELLRVGSLDSLWISNEHVFDGAAVFTCAPTIHIGGSRNGSLRRSATSKFIELPAMTLDNNELAGAETWAHLAAAASGVPEISLDSYKRISELATATADFRDQYYGLDGFLVEHADIADSKKSDSDFPKIVTTGLIDLAECKWGTTSTRILKRKWIAPRIDRRRMECDGTLGPWLTVRSCAKIMLATQTRVIELLVDEQGVLIPSLPIVTVVPKDPEDLWKVAAALASPVASAVALCRYAGAAMATDAIKMSAKQVVGLPMPSDSGLWEQGAAILREAHCATTEDSRLALLKRFGVALCGAYGLTSEVADNVHSWWWKRLAGKSVEVIPDA